VNNHGHGPSFRAVESCPEPARPTRDHAFTSGNEYPPESSAALSVPSSFSCGTPLGSESDASNNLSHTLTAVTVSCPTHFRRAGVRQSFFSPWGHVFASRHAVLEPCLDTPPHTPALSLRAITLGPFTFSRAPKKSPFKCRTSSFVPVTQVSEFRHLSSSDPGHFADHRSLSQNKRAPNLRRSSLRCNSNHDIRVSRGDVE